MAPSSTGRDDRPDVPAAQGFSLVELLVAMSLGLVLVSGMISVFAGNRRSSDINTAMTTMQENVRFAIDAIAGDIRMAGHQGCLDFNQRTATVIANDAPTTNLQETAIGGSLIETASSWKPGFDLGSRGGDFTPPAAADRAAVPGTHALALQFGGPASSRLRAGGMVSGGVEDPSAPLLLEDTLDVQVDDQVLVTTCESGELFTVTGVGVDVDDKLSLAHAATKNSRGNFQEAYGANVGNAAQVQVMRFSTNVYYVGETGLENDDGEPLRALYQQSAPFNLSSNPAIELVRGVENMQLSFGIGRSGGRLRYVTGDHDDYDPEQVKSVRIGLLMVSRDAIAAAVDEKTYVLAGQSVRPSTSTSDGVTYKADKRFRLAFNTTVKVRNRRAD